MDQTQDPAATDPDNVPEILCIGKLNVSVAAGLATMTFTHVRQKAGPLLDRSSFEPESVVRARIVTTIENMVAMRDVINGILTQIQVEAQPLATSSGQLN